MASLWEEFSDIFYDNKCVNGLIDPNRPNHYQFEKKNYLFAIDRIEEEYRLRIHNKRIIVNDHYRVDVQLFSKDKKEIEDKILQWIKGK